MPNVLDSSPSWTGEPGAKRPRAPFLRRLSGRCRDLIGPDPEDELIAVSDRSADNPGVLILAFIGALAVLPVIAVLRDGGHILEAVLPIAGIAAVFEIATQLVERRYPRALWLMALKVAFYAGTTGAALWALLAISDPVAYARHPIAFMIYLLLITTAGLRDEPRLPIAAGMFSLISYLLVAGFVPRIAEVSEPVKAAALLRGFDGTSVIAHGVILFCITLMSVATARRGQAVRRLSVRDGLTGLVNRRIFDACLATEGERARRSGQPLSIAMIDVDFFKSLNDTYGHAFGDDVLRWISQLLRESFRTTDLVARYGGEEFAVVFVDSADDRLAERLDALRFRISDAELRPSEGGEVVHVSVSVGVASWPVDGDDVQSVLVVADQRLYLAKGAGRNRVVAAPFDGE